MDFAVIAQRIKEQFCKPDTEEAANTALSYMVNGEYFQILIIAAAHRLGGRCLRI